jgi:putative Holliday junction resolvase
VGRILAIDPGERRLGFALSDPTQTIASPLAVYARVGWARDLAHIRALVETHDVTTIVVGRPLTLRGTAGPQADRAQAFASRLRDAVAVPVVDVDERLTTAAADRLLRERGARASTRRRARDAVAAALILQTFLDRRAAEPLRPQDEGVMLAP